MTTFLSGAPLEADAVLDLDVIIRGKNVPAHMIIEYVHGKTIGEAVNKFCGSSPDAAEAAALKVLIFSYKIIDNRLRYTFAKHHRSVDDYVAAIVACQGIVPAVVRGVLGYQLNIGDSERKACALIEGCSRLAEYRTEETRRRAQKGRRFLFQDDYKAFVPRSITSKR